MSGFCLGHLDITKNSILFKYLDITEASSCKQFLVFSVLYEYFFILGNCVQCTLVKVVCVSMGNILKKDADPDVWIIEHFGNDINKIADYKNKNYIDTCCTMQWNDFKTFKEKRTEALRAALMLAFK